MKFTIPFLSIKEKTLTNIQQKFEMHFEKLLIVGLIVISICNFIIYYSNKLGLAYNDARSHLDIGRRVVEGLKPGLAQLGSVWLPLPHLLMVPTIWNDFMWHSGLSGALQSMIAFVITGMLIYLFLKKLNVDMLGRIIAVFVWVTNVNVLYMQSTAMTELLLIMTSLAGMYYLYLWQRDSKALHLMKAAFWIMLASLNRYDGWFLFCLAILIIGIITFRKKGYKTTEGTILFFSTIAGFGIVLWFLWNLVIFKDPLYFILGPYSAHAQQQQLANAGVLSTKGNLLLSLKVYYYAAIYNVGMIPSLLGVFGAIIMYLDKKISRNGRLALTLLWSPFLFNVLALYLGHSVLFVQGISGDTWFNVRYGLMMVPSIAIFIGYLIYRLKNYRYVFIGLLLLVTVLANINRDAVTIDDARVGSSQKNVTEVSGWLGDHAANKEGFVLISAASHDAIIFSSGLPMTKFIHEGTGDYWKSATKSPDRWARWIIMRTNDNNDQTFRLVNETHALSKYTLVGHYPFADIYEIKPEFVGQLETKPVIKNQK